MRIASFDVDPQKGFTELCPDELPVPGGHLIAAELNAMARRAQLRVGSKDAHPANALWEVDDPQQMGRHLDLPNADCTWVRHCVPGTPGFEYLDGLPRPGEYDFLAYKGIEPDCHPYGACYHDLAEQRSTGVIEFLREQGVQAVIVGGLALDICVRVTASQLTAASFLTLLYLPACRALSASAGRAAAQQLQALGVTICEDGGQLDAALERLAQANQ